jgi:hypothetical protein
MSGSIFSNGDQMVHCRKSLRNRRRLDARRALYGEDVRLGRREGENADNADHDHDQNDESNLHD